MSAPLDPDAGLPPAERGVPAPDDLEPLDRAVVETSLVDAILHQVERRPDHEAVRGATGTLTYREVAERSAALAAALAARVPPGTPVAFLTPHDHQAVVAMVGILRAGAGVVPLDPLQPPAAQQAILEQCGSPVLVAAAPLRTDAEATGAEVLLLEDLPAPPEDLSLPTTGPDDLAVILYTSGSTGEPKGVYSTQRCELQTMWAMANTMRYRRSDRSGVVMPLSYRFALAFTACSLLTGGTVCFYDLRKAGFPGLPGWVAEEEITTFPLVPTILRGLASGPPGRPFPTVRSVMVSGERAEPADIEAARRTFAEDVEIAHAFASTEAQIVAWQFLGPDTPVGAPVPAGRAAPDKVLEVVDPDGALLPPGQVGEVVVRSAYLTEGYWRRDDLTDVVFSPPAADGTRSFRTGDLGSLDEHGRLTLAGREDDQVKVRGHRVELGEIEAVLTDLDAVQEAVVVQQDADGRGALAAHVVLAEDRRQTTTADVRAALEELLPEHKVPAVIVLLERLPTLPNGKVDRRALPVVDLRAGRARAMPDEAPPPADDLEKELVRIWESAIELSPISVEDDFFAISDSSLQAAAIVVAIEESLGVELAVSALLRANTVRLLAEEVRQAGQREQAAADAGLVRVSESTSGPRLLLCPDLSGSPFRFHPLVEALGPDVQVLGFESPLFHGPGRDVRTIEGLAAHNVAVATEADPEGPYHLAGWSVGGFVAFEMARQLRAAGRPVGAVVVVDAGPHLVSRSYPRFSRQRRRSKRTPRPVTPSRREDSDDGLVLRSLDAALPRPLADELVWRRDLRRHGQVRPDRRLPFVWRSNWRATKRYRFPRYEGDVDFITSRPEGAPDPTSGLDRHVDGELFLHRVEGEHELLVFDPLVDGVAEAIRTALVRNA